MDDFRLGCEIEDTMAIILPSDSGLDLTLTTPSGPQTRDPAVFSTLSYRQRVRFWRRQDGAIPVTADPGALLVDFSKQSLTVGVGTAYSNAIGNYTAARATQTHDSGFTGAGETLTATGWECYATAQSTPGSARSLRYLFNFSPAVDLSAVTSFTVELEYPQEMNPGDFGAGLYTGIRLMFIDSGGKYAWTIAQLWGTQGISKRRRYVVHIPATNKSGGLWSDGGGGYPTWSAITQMRVYSSQQSTNGGHRVTFRKIWANRVGKKALVAFTFDDGLRSTYQNGLPLLDAAGIKAGLSILSDVSALGSDPAFIWSADIISAYNRGHSLYNHMMFSDSQLESYFTPNATPWSGGLYTGNVDSEAYAAMTATETYTIRESWGPEVQGPLVLASKNGGTEVSFTVATAPALNSNNVGFPRLDIPGVSRAARIVWHVLPCRDYLAGLVGAGFRGHDIFVAPNNLYDVDWAADLASYGFKAVRRTSKYYLGTESSPYYVEGSMPILPGCFDPWDIAWYSLDNKDNTAGNRNTLEDAVDYAISTGSFIHFGGHGVDATHGPLSIHVDLLDHLIDYVKTKIDAGEAQNVTLEQIAGWYPYDPNK